MYIVTLTYVVDLAKIDAVITDHLVWLDQNYADGVFIASGRQEPRVGGVILAGGVSRDELDRRLLLDPFNELGLATYTVIQFIPSRASLELQALIA